MRAHYIPNPADSSSVLITAGFVVAGGQVPDLEMYPVPAAEVASIVHHGPMTGIAAAYQDSPAGLSPRATTRPSTPSWRELYLEANGDDQSDWIVEGQLELT